MNNKTNQKSNKKAVPEAIEVLNVFKNEVAKEIGIEVPDDGYWGNMTSKECGHVGGNMVKKLIELAESELIGKI